MIVSLKTRLRAKPILLAPGVYDPLTASLAADAGFEALYLSGASIAYTRLGRPDIGLVTMTEVADTISLIRDRVATPLIVDADNGYGNALNMQRTMRLFERAGANALQASRGEETRFRNRNGWQDSCCGRCAGQQRNAYHCTHGRRSRRGLSGGY
jgi:2-methylisocitrate lyase-like PEP mutase family enzyme